MEKPIQHFEGVTIMTNIDDKVLKLNEVAIGEDKVRLVKMHNAVVATLKAYEVDYAAPKLKGYQAAEKARNDIIDALWPKYFPSDIHLPHQRAVVAHLNSVGYKIKKSSISNHVKEGKLRPLEDGTFALKDVEKYASTFLHHRTSQQTAAAMGESQMDIARAEYEKLCNENELLRLKIDEKNGSLVSRSHFEHEIAARAQILRLDAESFARGNAQAIVALISGDELKTPELVAFLLSEIETWFARYTDQEYQVESDPEPSASDISASSNLKDEDDKDQE